MPSWSLFDNILCGHKIKKNKKKKDGRRRFQYVCIERTHNIILQRMPGKYQPYKCSKPVPFVVCTGITTRNGPTVGFGIVSRCQGITINYYRRRSFLELHHPHENLEGSLCVCVCVCIFGCI